MAPDWSREEVELVVADYLEMLAAHFAGQQVKKSERRRLLQTRLNARNDSSVERKRSNISAVVERLGFHYLPGYKPLANYQRMLDSVVAQQIASAPWLDEAALAAVQLPAVAQVPGDFSKVRTNPPKINPRAREPISTFEAVKRDYLEREARNRSLGKAGEEFVVEYERWRLKQFGEDALARRVDWVATTKGDGLGYDVLSFEADGATRYIEVKTTSFGVVTPFFVTSTELKFAKANSQSFHLYRIFDFRHAPKLFSLVGNPAEHCLLDPVSYRASFI
jgi:Domain of unknown function (DUF3883)